MNLGFFSDIIKAKSFNYSLHDYNLYLGLHFHSRFDDLDLISRSQVCQKCEVQIACFKFLSSVL